MSVGKIILGTAQFGMNYGVNNPNGMIPVGEIRDILKICEEFNIKAIDTADEYGRSQEVLSENKFNHANFKIYSKFILPEGGDISVLEQKINKTCLRLGVNSIEGYSFHRFQDYLNFSDPSHLSSLKKKGKVNKIGASLYLNSEVEHVLTQAKLDMIQIPFNVLDNYSLRKDVLREAKSLGVEVHVRSIFLQGLFFMNPGELKGNTKDLKHELIQLASIARDNKLTMHELCVRYILSIEEIGHILIGINSASQLKENIKMFKKGPLGKKIIQKIESIKIRNKKLLNPGNWRF